MKLGVVSDSHGHAANTMRAVELLREQQVDVVLHCGDVGGWEVVSQFTEWPTHFVAGNCDDIVSLQMAVQQAKQHWHHWQGEITLQGRQIALLHSHRPGQLTLAATAEEYDLVCYGHTHAYETHQVGNTHVLNPGALYRANPLTLAVVDLETMAIEHLPLS